MTQQMHEKLFIDMEPNSLLTQPLDGYFAAAGFDPKFDDWWCSAMWRGYLGTWDICEKLLYLIGLEGRFKDGTEVSVSAFFPRQNDRVFAFWYTGILQVPKGRVIKTDLMSYSIYEDDLFLTVENGVVVNSYLRHNGIAIDPNAEDARFGCTPAAMTFFGTAKASIPPGAEKTNTVRSATVSNAEFLDSGDDAELRTRCEGHVDNSKSIDIWKLDCAQTHYQLGAPTHHGPCERIAQPKLWTNFQDVAEFACKRSVTLETEIVIQWVKGGWVLPYYLAVWNGYVESEEAANDREAYFRQNEELAEASQRDDERKREEE